MHIAQRKQGVMKSSGLDQWHAQRVAPDYHALRQAFYPDDALVWGHAVAVATVQE